MIAEQNRRRSDRAADNHHPIFTAKPRIQAESGLAERESAATALHSFQIVGTSGDHAFLWENGVMQDLETLIPPATPTSNWLLYSANGIGDNGLIVGEGLA